MSIQRIFNENCFDTMNKMLEYNQKVDLILTSPPYNISRGIQTDIEINEHKSKYKEYKDNLPNEEYRDFIKEVFIQFDKILNPNGVVLFNLSYASCLETDSRCSDLIKLLYKIVDETNFDIADVITWKKKSALPSNRNNKLTRICEYIFVLCRKNEYATFNHNKQLKSWNKEKNLKYYENVFNFIEAKNNDIKTDLNKATFSTELVFKLLNIYANNNTLVYDPFMGTGTTAVACKQINLTCFGSELSKEQVEFANERLSNVEL